MRCSSESLQMSNSPFFFSHDKSIQSLHHYALLAASMNDAVISIEQIDVFANHDITILVFF